MTSPQRKQNAPVPSVLLILAVTTGTLALVLGWADEPWSWALSVLQIVVTVTMLIYLGRFVRKQRDDYWRERGKDPRHPEL